jgi:hypothetical protein
MTDGDVEWRTLPHVTVQREVRDLWVQAMNLLRNRLGVGGNLTPSPTALYELAALTILQSTDLQVPERYRDDVLAGVARCWYPRAVGGVLLTIPATGRALLVCGQYAPLEQHHVIPRSHGGHEGPLAWLCVQHHASVTQNRGGKGWRWLAAALGFAEPPQEPRHA